MILLLLLIALAQVDARMPWRRAQAPPRVTRGGRLERRPQTRQMPRAKGARKATEHAST